MRTVDNFYIRYLDRNIMQSERNRIFHLVKQMLPFASVMEVGSTAAEGVVGKQDLDFALRVPAGRFYEAQSILDSHFDRNERQRPVVGHQCYLVHSQLDVSLHLVVSGGNYDNDFERFLQLLLKKSELRLAYNNLKIAWNGRPMNEYRRAKKTFIESALSKG
jgi:GrpB-like predicted nucleotidyltransferase (UPF0157 family)